LNLPNLLGPRPLAVLPPDLHPPAMPAARVQEALHLLTHLSRSSRLIALSSSGLGPQSALKIPLRLPVRIPLHDQCGEILRDNPLARLPTSPSPTPPGTACDSLATRTPWRASSRGEVGAESDLGEAEPSLCRAAYGCPWSPSTSCASTAPPSAVLPSGLTDDASRRTRRPLYGKVADRVAAAPCAQRPGVEAGHDLLFGAKGIGGRR
jgi:hypothetical protein